MTVTVSAVAWAPVDLWPWYPSALRNGRLRRLGVLHGAPTRRLLLFEQRYWTSRLQSTPCTRTLMAQERDERVK